MSCTQSKDILTKKADYLYSVELCVKLFPFFAFFHQKNINERKEEQKNAQRKFRKKIFKAIIELSSQKSNGYNLMEEKRPKPLLR